MIRKIAIVYLFALLAITYGFAIGYYKVFPYQYVAAVIKYIEGDPDENTNVLEKLANDFLDVPKRFLHTGRSTHPGVDRLGPVVSSKKVFVSSRNLPEFYSNIRQGYYLIYGLFEFLDGRYGFLLVNSNGEIVRHWPFEIPAVIEHPDIFDNEKNFEINPTKGGFMPDGTLISNLSHKLQARSFCGDVLWNILEPQLYAHHSIEPTFDGHFWNFDNLELQKRKVESGELVDSFSILDLINSNPDLHILEARIKQYGWKSDNMTQRAQITGKQEFDFGLEDPFHFNDLEPLPDHLSQYYPGFQTGDLVVSARSINLIFVFRPATKQILWYMYGKTSRQHDPDFNSKGTLTIYNNRNHNHSSEIVEVDLSSQRLKTLVDGAELNLFQGRHGNHTVLEDGSIVIVDFHGKIYHLAEDQSPLFVFKNTYSDSDILELRNAWHLSDREFEALNSRCH